MNRSIRARVLLVASLALVGFLGLTGMVLDRAFRSSAQSAVRDYLQTQVYGLLAAAELGPDGGLVMPQSLPEPRLSQASSGLYARVSDAAGGTVWKSPSTIGTGIAGRSPAPGEFAFRRDVTESGRPVFLLSYSVIWEAPDADERPFVFTVAEDFTLFQSRVNAFRRTLWLWLLGSVVVLVVVQLAALMWILRPLKNIASEVNRIERGELSRLSTDYPDELQSLALNLNALLVNERNQRQRYRDKLDDLAHSLKTPLAVLRNLADRQQGGDGDRSANQNRNGNQNQDSDVLNEVAGQVDRMQGIVSYQLRSAAGGSGEFALAHPVRPELDRIVRSLEKAYSERDIDIEVNVPARCTFRGDVGDFMEIVGNIMDNACKYCRRRVAVSVDHAGDGDELTITVEDDGPGIPEAARATILDRHTRGDSRTEGHGLGLAIARGIAADYGGNLEIAAAGLGGARVIVRIPGAAGQ